MTGDKTTVVEVCSNWISGIFYPIILNVIVNVTIVIISGTLWRAHQMCCQFLQFPHLPCHVLFPAGFPGYCPLSTVTLKPVKDPPSWLCWSPFCEDSSAHIKDTHSWYAKADALGARVRGSAWHCPYFFFFSYQHNRRYSLFLLLMPECHFIHKNVWRFVAPVGSPWK